MAGEVYAFSRAFDSAFIIKHDLESVYNHTIPLIMLTDSKQMFDVITKAKHTTVRRLMIDIAAAREAYVRGEISNLGLVMSGNNVADSLTKTMFCPEMRTLLSSGTNKLKVQQWIIRIGKGIERP